MKFELHTVESAPEAVKSELENAEKTYGSIPNLYRGLANNPATLKMYLDFNTTLKEFGSLSSIEQQVVYLTVSVENACTYCVGAHSVLATMAKMPEATLNELRQQNELSESRYNALRNFTLAVMSSRGHVPNEELESFQDAGYYQRHVLEVLTILAQKTISNYYNHMAQTPLDVMFESQVWEK